MTVVPINGKGAHEPSATGTNDEGVESEPTRARARAREAAPNATTPVPRAAATNATPTATVPGSGRDRVADLVELVRPPELWSQPRPSLQQVWNYAAYGPWTDQSRTTPARVAGMAYSAFVVAVTAVGYSLLWVVERPGRFVPAVALAVLAGLSWVI